MRSPVRRPGARGDRTRWPPAFRAPPSVGGVFRIDPVIADLVILGRGLHLLDPSLACLGLGGELVLELLGDERLEGVDPVIAVCQLARLGAAGKAVEVAPF